MQDRILWQQYSTLHCHSNKVSPPWSIMLPLFPSPPSLPSASPSPVPLLPFPFSLLTIPSFFPLLLSFPSLLPPLPLPSPLPPLCLSFPSPLPHVCLSLPSPLPPLCLSFPLSPLPPTFWLPAACLLQSSSQTRYVHGKENMPSG